MNKRIKLIIVTILILLGIGLATTSQAYSPAGLFPQRVGTTTYYCKQKDGPLRFYVPDRPLGRGTVLPENYIKITVDDPDAGFLAYTYDLVKKLMDKKQELNQMIADLASEYKAYKIPGSDFNGKFPDAPGSNQWAEQTVDRTKEIDVSYKDSPQLLYQIDGKLLAGLPEYQSTGNYNENNNRIAYILSAGQNWVPNHYDKSNYQPSISDSATAQDIQYALWRDKGYNEGNTKVDKDVKDLYEESLDYENYNQNVKNVYENNDKEKLTIKTVTQTPTIIVNKNTGTYIVGPYVMNYPDYAKFAFVEDMYVKDQNNNRIDVKVIAESGSKYPRSGKPFFVEFSYNTNPTKIKLCAKFAYLQSASASYNKMEANGTPIYQYFGRMYVKFTTDMAESYTRIMANSAQGDYVSWEDLPDYWKTEFEEYKENSNYVYKRTEKEVLGVEYGYKIDLDYATDANKKQLTYNPQIAAEVYYANRVWNLTDEISSTDIDISMKIGGKVFVDVATGKETAEDGIYNSNTDKAMPGVQVELYSKSRGLIGTTTTDVNGNYQFTNLNVLDQYYAKFIYNGQYYEPTYYTALSNNNEENYQNTSNGTDYVETRVKLNQRFSSIGSSPENYDATIGYDSQYVRDQIIDSKYNRTFSKMQLLGYTLNSDGKYVKTGKAIIDSWCAKCNKNENHEHTEECYRTFGNLTKYAEDGLRNNTLTQTEREMVQYVKDCKMYSWTKNNGINKTSDFDDVIDYYPNSPILIISNSYDRDGKNIIKYNNVKTVESNLSDYTTIMGIVSKLGEQKDDKSQYINQGYKLRQEADVALKEDVYSATIEINGKSEKYLYNQREGKTTEEDEKGWEIGARIESGYYGTLYTREIYPSDYDFKISDYGQKFSEYGKTEEDELNVYVTYLIKVMNCSQSVKTRIDEIVHYFDQDYEYVPERSYIEFTKYVGGEEIKEKYDVGKKDVSKYSSQTTTTLSGYDTMYITGLEGRYLNTGETAEIYLTFRVEKDTINNLKWVRLDEFAQTAEAIGVGKESISEINGYSTVYKTGTEIPNVGKTGENVVAGLVDIDSNPGNLNPDDVPKDGKIKYENFEDDTDKAPNLRLRLFRGHDRLITGYVWEDERNLINNSQATATGNGIREDKEKLINGVTVEFVELMDNGTEHIWRTYEYGTGTAKETTPIINTSNVVQNYKFEGETKGTYAFKSFAPGNYIVRFKYGDTVKTVLAKNSDATKLLINEYGLSNDLKKLLNDTSYNGQDYKSTIYQSGLGTYNGKNISKQYNYDIAKGDTALVSDAKDLYNVRQKVIDYSDGTVKNAFAELLASYESIPEYNNSKYDKNTMKSYLNEFIAKTAMIAETGVIDMSVEYNTDATNVYDENGRIIETIYHLSNLDLGLEERPKAQIEINKNVKNLKITLADGTVLFDAVASADNLLWNPNPFSGYYENNLMRIRTPREFGLVQPTMDQELMHGATVRITYEITAKNIGEADYKEEQFYYTGVVKDKNTISTTNAIQLVDYVPNNIQYYEVDNKDYWTVISKDKVKEQLIDTGLVNSRLLNNLEKFNTIVTTTKTNTALYPTIYTEKVDKNKVNSVSVPIVLTQLITAENKTADLTYNNMVELVAQSNTVGRKMAYSVPGNQDPTKDVSELDADKATVRILPPFGVILTYVIIALITIAGAAIIAGGIIFIKKKVLTK